MKTVLFIHGYSAKKEDNIYFINYLKEKHIDVNTFVLPGHSENGVKESTSKEWIEASEKELKKLIDKNKKVILIGHSMGGAIATILASRYKVEKLVLIAPGFSLGSFNQNINDFKNLVLGKNEKELGTGFEGVLTKTLTVNKKTIKEVKKVSLLAKHRIKDVKCPLLLLHGTIDNVVSINHSIEAFGEFNCKKTFTLLTNVRHQVFKSNKKYETSKYIYNFIKGGIPFLINKKNQL